VPTPHAYGIDYSGGEFSPGQLDAYSAESGRDLRVLFRYIGYPDNGHYISHYPGAYQRHVDAGRVVLLIYEWDVDDVVGGWQSGREHALRAVNDANGIGYPDTLPIFMSADKHLNELGVSTSTAMAYLDGAASVLGRQRTGAYGFSDFIYAAQDGGHAPWLWLCGAKDTVRDGIQFYQCNNYGKFQLRPDMGSSEPIDVDLDEIYIDPDAISQGGFLMALEQWKQDRIFERILSMSEGVAGQSPAGDQFLNEQAQRDAVAANIDTLIKQVQTLSGKVDQLMRDRVGD